MPGVTIDSLEHQDMRINRDAIGAVGGARCDQEGLTEARKGSILVGLLAPHDRKGGTLMHDIYLSPLSTRYSSAAMKHVFSDDTKFQTWRRLWIALAESEQALGLPITDAQIAELKAHITDIDYERAAVHEKAVRHDVMAHVLTYGECCPGAKGIIHLGATSCYVGDNTDVIQMRQAALLVRKLLVNTIRAVRDFAMATRALPTLAFTHFQAAQPTTVGKRASLWLQDLMMDLESVDELLPKLKLLGCKGTTGTQASFLELFQGDHDKVKRLEQLICEKMGYSEVFPVSGQTYTRKLDFLVLSVLAGIAQSAHKFSNDLRLLSHLKEFDEPFESGQIGSSAMAYKRNPMRSERIASLARYVMADLQNPQFTAAGQWFERTLDDSANRRIAVPEAFLAVDAMLSLYLNIISGCRIYPKIMERHLREELPFMATENIMMYCVKEKNGDRQALHEAIRTHSVAAAQVVKNEGGENDLLERILSDETFGLTQAELTSLLKPEQFVGRAPEQVAEYVSRFVDPVLEENRAELGVEVEIKV